MSARYFAGKWNEHEIVVVSSDNEKLIVDGKVVAENKPGLHFFYVTLTGEIPIDPELSVTVIFEGSNCCCIVGKPLETSYDKETKTFFTEYYGHKLEANNKKLKGTLIVDGVETDKEDGMFNSFAILGSKATKDGKRYMAILEPDGLKVKCQFYAEAENVRMYYCQKQGGELIPVNRPDGDDNFAAGFMIGMSI